MIRPGRLEELIELKKPILEEREEILKIKTKDYQTIETIDFKKISEYTIEYSGILMRLLLGADIDGLCKEVFMNAMRRDPENPIVTELDFLMIIESKLK